MSLRRRAAVAAASSLVWTITSASPALAHGLGGRLDLPVPRWLFVFGAATALVVSFVLLGALWRSPRFPLPEREARDGALQRLLRNPILEWALRLTFLAVFLVVTVASLLPRRIDATIGPVAVFIWFWVGAAFLAPLVGDWWATLSPFDTLGRLLGLDDDQAAKPYPASWGSWPAAGGLFGFVWFELADPFGGRPGILGIAIVVYTAAQVFGMARYGRAAWIREAEAFSVYLGLFARMAPLRRDRSGRVVVTVPVAGLADTPVRPGVLALILVALGSTTFDGLSRTGLWLDATVGLAGIARPLASTAALAATIILVGGLYALAMKVAAATAGGGGWHVLVARFAHTLVPIALAYVVAHYFSYLFIEGQIGIARASDPFDLGWNLFGTADRPIDLTLLGPVTVWYVQVAAIVLGHVAGVVLAHDLALRLFPEGGAVRTQFALLAVMVVFTAGGLLILSG